MASAVFTLDKREVCICGYLEQLKGVSPESSDCRVQAKTPKEGNLEYLKTLRWKAVSCLTVPDQEFLSDRVRNQVCGFWGLCVFRSSPGRLVPKETHEFLAKL